MLFPSPCSGAGCPGRGRGCAVPWGSPAWQALSPRAGDQASSPPFTSFLLLFSPAQQFLGIITFCHVWGCGRGLAPWQGAGTAALLSQEFCILEGTRLGCGGLGGTWTLWCMAQGGCIALLRAAPAVPGDSEGPH